MNNAGITHIGAVADTDAESVVDVIGTNLIGAFLTSARFLHDLHARGAGGDIIFISSSAAQQPWPYQVLYGTAKTGMDALARGLQLELEGTGIRSTIVRVGPVESEIGANLDSSAAMDIVAEWQRFGVLRNFAFLPTEQVARTVAMVAGSAPGDVPAGGLRGLHGTHRRTDGGRNRCRHRARGPERGAMSASGLA